MGHEADVEDFARFVAEQAFSGTPVAVGRYDAVLLARSYLTLATSLRGLGYWEGVTGKPLLVGKTWDEAFAEVS